MIDPQVQIFLAVNGKAFMKAAESDDPNAMYQVISGAEGVIQTQLHRAFNAAAQTIINQTGGAE